MTLNQEAPAITPSLRASTPTTNTTTPRASTASSLENELGNYSIQEQKDHQHDDTNQEEPRQQLRETDTFYSSSSESLSTTTSSSSSSSSSSAITSQTTLLHFNDRNRSNGSSVGMSNHLEYQSQQDGIIHGHIHNFENFTYIHGHIHTNGAAPLQVIPSLPSQHNHCHSQHCHPNDKHASNFTECQHFEFLNCHDNLEQGNLIIEDSDLKCEEDANCKPKIMEICCEDPHPHLASQSSSTEDADDRLNDDNGMDFSIPSLQPNLPHCVSNAILPANVSNAMSNVNANTLEGMKFSQCEQNGTGSGADLNCGLDTCAMDDLCRFCDEMGIPQPDMSTPNEQQQHQQQQQQQQQTELEQRAGSKRGRDDQLESTNSQHIHDHSHAQNHSHNHTGQIIHEHTHEHNHLHHLHHHSHDHKHSENHHHHHIQLHDHHDHPLKKQCTTSCSSNNDLINFSWNFKNQPKTCEWGSCDLVLDNPIQLQHHIMENHLIALPQTTRVASTDDVNLKEDDIFGCEWKDCEFLCEDLFQLVNHINCTHNTQKEFNIGSVPILNSTLPTPPTQLTTPAPQQQHYEHQQAQTHDQIEQEREETKCQWHVPGQPPCNLQFTNGGDLTNHILRDHIGCGKSSYVCYWADCDREHRVFPQRQKIIRHMHVHTKYKPFACPICDHHFISETILDQHMRTHSGEKPYACEICHKRFARSSSLSIHNRVHTGEKPLVCKYPGCNKRFSESSNLTKHMKTHEKGWKCDKCGKGFAKGKSLEQHYKKCCGTGIGASSGVMMSTTENFSENIGNFIYASASDFLTSNNGKHSNSNESLSRSFGQTLNLNSDSNF